MDERGIEITEDEYLETALDEVEFEQKTDGDLNGLGSGRQRKA